MVSMVAFTYGNGVRAVMKTPSKSTFSPNDVFLAPVDALAWFASFFIAVLFRFEFVIDGVNVGKVALLALLFVVVWFVVGHPHHLYRKRFLVGSKDELSALIRTLFIVSGLAGSASLIFGTVWGVSRSLALIAIPVFLLLSGGIRFIVRRSWSRSRVASVSVHTLRALVLGAGDAAESLIPQLLFSEKSPFTPVALLDDDPTKVNRWIEGIPMAGTWADAATAARRFRAESVIVAIPSATSELLARVYHDARKLDLQVVVLPSLREYLGGRAGAGELRQVSIEDLIGRQAVEFNAKEIFTLLRDKRVLVTGAGGSIGSELARQIATFEPSLLVLADRDESGLLMTSLGLPADFPDSASKTFLLDIRDPDALEELFQKHKPEVVFHAAALKHLSMLESHPREAWKTNVIGTLQVLEAAHKSEVGVFVNISTDKAANPANILGRSKMLAEQLTAWFGSTSNRPYVSVRFGNVLGSRGSLIPVISQQIESGGPVTITDKRATRYFMSISEACQLVLQAAAAGDAGDVMVLDMGEPVNINSIAERMIELSGREVTISYLGLRPGEKLHEELFSESEKLRPSIHPKIMRITSVPRTPQEVLTLKW